MAVAMLFYFGFPSVFPFWFPFIYRLPLRGAVGGAG
jgi:hypothetical protein